MLRSSVLKGVLGVLLVSGVLVVFAAVSPAERSELSEYELQARSATAFPGLVAQCARWSF